MGYHLGSDGRSGSDLLIHPLENHFHWTDFESYRELVQLGETATEAVLDDIVGLVEKRSGPRWRLASIRPVAKTLFGWL